MHIKHKNTIVFIISWLATTMLIGYSIMNLPGILEERNHLVSLYERLSDSLAIENRLSQFMAEIEASSAAINSIINEYESVVDSSDFSRLPAEKIPEFIDSLPDLLSRSGVTVLNLGYQARERIGEFEDLMFEVHVRCNYQNMRKLLHELETHKAGIRIDRLEFVNFDDENHMTQIRLNCKVRFENNG